MTSVYFPSMSGIMAGQQQVDVIANNLANLSTTGFKAARAQLVSLPSQRSEVARAGEAVLGPVDLGGGVMLGAVTRQFTTGPIQVTGNPLDLAIVGDGATFFAVRRRDGTVAYTRAGALSIDANGQLVTADGAILEPPITLSPGARIDHVDAQGRIYAVQGSANAPTVVGQLQLVRFPNPNGLIALGNGQFSATPAAGQPEVGTPGAPGWPTIGSGMLEAANVDLATEMTQLIIAQRAYVANIRALQTTDEMVALAIQTRS